MFELVKSATFDVASARGWAHVPSDVPFLADHFPGLAVLPGSLQIELCAQIAGPLAEQAVAAQYGIERWAFLGMVRNAAFYAVAPLPIDLVITVELRRVEQAAVVAAVTTLHGDEQLCRAEVVMVMREAEPQWAEAIAKARARVASWKALA